MHKKHNSGFHIFEACVNIDNRFNLIYRSRSRERLRSRSPVMGRKLTFKEQMRKEFINASKEMSNQEHKGMLNVY